MEANSNPLKTDKERKFVNELNPKIDGNVENIVKERNVRHHQREGAEKTGAETPVQNQGKPRSSNEKTITGSSKSTKRQAIKNEPPSEEVARAVEEFLKNKSLIDKSFEEAIVCVFGSTRSMSSLICPGPNRKPH